ncbi:hypothetical protein ACFYXP_20955 [Streptomyces sp. NPDC002466]|uniref:hypothetical protein n=1 Tax=Streptomyces sp. NPDC002466 TaxID=3364646 RepID=UPI00368AFA79
MFSSPASTTGLLHTYLMRGAEPWPVPRGGVEHAFTPYSPHPIAPGQELPR